MAGTLSYSFFLMQDIAKRRITKSTAIFEYRLNMVSKLENTIFSIQTDEDFFSCCLEVFQYQRKNNEVYSNFIDHLPSFKEENIKSICDFPFLPIQFFKTQKVLSTPTENPTVFQSSGTTSDNASKHYVHDIKLYEKSFLHCFEQFYGNIEGTCIIGLLPSYLERKNSSLIYMVQKLIELSKHPKSGFYLHPEKELVNYLHVSADKKILFGVTFALLDFAEQNITLKNTTIIETGGMKGRGEELTRMALHEKLQQSFQCDIHSEYGMTELLSQAYNKNGLTFTAPNWMQVLMRDANDPFDIQTHGKGAINIIDLANIHSCAFIATDDIGQVHQNKTFEVNGRLDNSDLRGCNLLVV